MKSILLRAVLGILLKKEVYNKGISQLTISSTAYKRLSGSQARSSSSSTVFYSAF